MIHARPTILRPILAAALVATALFLGACEREPRTVTLRVPGGDSERGPELMRHYGCHSCHTVEGVPGARGLVGPSLTGIAERIYIAGILPNTSENLIRWIMDPQEVQPGNVMPDTGVGEEDARHIAAYLYTLE